MLVGCHGNGTITELLQLITVLVLLRAGNELILDVFNNRDELRTKQYLRKVSR
jgi:hypothetical protein